jgi:hypothetical protein
MLRAALRGSSSGSSAHSTLCSVLCCGSSRRRELSFVAADWISACLRQLQPSAPAEVEHRPFAGHTHRSTVWRNALPAATLPSLIAEARAVGDLEANESSGTFQPTRWFPIEQTPRFTIERAIRTLQHDVLRLDADADGLVGCEWWVQHIDVASPLAFHLDKDECAAAEPRPGLSAQLHHPGLSSVVYLSHTGGATAVLPQYAVPDEEGGGVCVHTDAPGEIDLVQPRPGQFLAFQGNLMHGVLSDPTGGGATVPGLEDGVAGGGAVVVPGQRRSGNRRRRRRLQGQRVGSAMTKGAGSGQGGGERRPVGDRRLTLLVNWWQRTPRRPCCSPVPVSMAEQLAAIDTDTPLPAASSNVDGGGAVLEQLTVINASVIERALGGCVELSIDMPPHLQQGPAATQVLRLPRPSVLAGEVGCGV